MLLRWGHVWSAPFDVDKKNAPSKLYFMGSPGSPTHFIWSSTQLMEGALLTLLRARGAPLTYGGSPTHYFSWLKPWSLSFWSIFQRNDQGLRREESASSTTYRQRGLMACCWRQGARMLYVAKIVAAFCHQIHMSHNLCLHGFHFRFFDLDFGHLKF